MSLPLVRHSVSLGVALPGAHAPCRHVLAQWTWRSHGDHGTRAGSVQGLESSKVVAHRSGPARAPMPKAQCPVALTRACCVPAAAPGAAAQRPGRGLGRPAGRGGPAARGAPPQRARHGPPARGVPRADGRRRRRRAWRGARGSRSLKGSRAKYLHGRIGKRPRQPVVMTRSKAGMRANRTPLQTAAHALFLLGLDGPAPWFAVTCLLQAAAADPCHGR